MGVLSRIRRVGVRLQLVALLALVLGLFPGAVPMAAADGPGEFIVQPKPGVRTELINSRYGTRTLFTLSGTNTLVLWSATAQATAATINRDMQAGTAPIVWWELSTGASDPRAKDDSGADPYCPPLPTTVRPAPVASTDDSGADGQRCTRAIQDGERQYQSSYAATKLNLDPASTKSRGKDVIVAVIDTRVETNHPLLAGKTLAPIDLVPLSPVTNIATTGRVEGHGTFVAGLVLRVAPEAKILPIRVLNEDGRGSTALVAEGIRRATDARAQVINLSLTTYQPSKALKEAVDYARKKNVLLVAAYGNEALQKPAVYPSDLSGVISVVATDEADVRARFSNDSRQATVAAPGVNVVSSWKDGQYAMGSGTSYAAPLVAGQAALLLAVQPQAKADTVQSLIQTAADNISAANDAKANKLGYGRANVGRSMTPRMK